MESSLLFAVLFCTFMVLQGAILPLSVAVMPAPAPPPPTDCTAFGGGGSSCPGVSGEGPNVCNGQGHVAAVLATYPRNSSGCLSTTDIPQILRDIAAALNGDSACGGGWMVSQKTGGTNCSGIACDIVCQVNSANCPLRGEALVDVIFSVPCGGAQWNVLPCRCFDTDPPPQPDPARPCIP